MANGDEERTIDNAEDAQWADAQRRGVEAYLSLQQCNHAGVSLEPRWYLPPYIAVWAVRSKSNPGAVGWWAISGDVPTDYMTATREIRSEADVLAAFGARWLDAAEAMSRGQHVGIGTPDQTAQLAPLLRSRAEILLDLAEQLRDEPTET
jgi:hypothetical protein